MIQINIVTLKYFIYSLTITQLTLISIFSIENLYSYDVIYFIFNLFVLIYVLINFGYFINICEMTDYILTLKNEHSQYLHNSSLNKVIKLMLNLNHDHIFILNAIMIHLKIHIDNNITEILQNDYYICILMNVLYVYLVVIIKYILEFIALCGARLLIIRDVIFHNNIVIQIINIEYYVKYDTIEHIFQYGICDECCICYTKYNKNDDIKILSCAHYYHKYCINRWLKYHNTCPKCKNITN